MKKRPAKKTTRAEALAAKMHASGFRAGVDLERIGIVNRLRMWGLVDLARALEDEDGFMFAFYAHRLAVALGKPPKELRLDEDDPQMNLLDWSAPTRTGGRRKRRAQRGAR